MLISIVVPVFNRERFVQRCVDSVLAQGFGDFELILVDDGSTDDSLLRLREYDDPRVRVLTHDRNIGVGTVRNAGVDAAEGEWIVFLDSDDELVPGALALIADRSARTGRDVGGLFFRCRMDSGLVSPEALSRPRAWDYRGYVGFLDETVGQWRDVLRCMRRSCCEVVRWPYNRMDASKFLLDFARCFRLFAYPEVLLLYHQDAENHLLRFESLLDPRLHPQYVRDRADGFRDLLSDHGQFLAREAPRLYCQYLQLAAACATMADRRRVAFGYSLELLRRSPGLPRAWVLLAASFLGSRAVTLRRRLAGAGAGTGGPPQ
jgi:glycosyltransferase involved in cell wall biosynthesis